MERRSYWKDPLAWACNSGMFVFGAVIAVLGGLLPELSGSHDLNPALAGSLFLFLNSGALLVTLGSGILFERIGPKPILLVCSFLAGAGFLTMAGAASFEVLAVGVFLIGIGGGGQNAGTSALIASLYPAERAAALNRLGVSFGVGALSIPVLISSMLEHFGVAAILQVAAALGFVPGLLFLISRFPPVERRKEAQAYPLARLLTEPVVVLFSVLLFFQAGNEVTSGGWITTYLTDSLSVSPAVASLYLSGFWAGVVAGRLMAAPLLRAFSEATLVKVSALISAGILCLFMAFPQPFLSGLLAFLLGAGLSGIFPSVLGQASQRFPARSGAVLGLLMAVGVVGGMFIPWVGGALVEAVGAWGALLPVLMGTTVVFAIQSLIQRKY